MTRYILSLFCIAVLCGCGPSASEIEYTKDGHEIQRIDGCQYIKTNGGRGTYNLTHKGDCNNPIHTTP